MKERNNTLMMIYGMILAPIMLCVYMVDRMMLVPMFWIPVKNLRKWYGDGFEMWISIIRLIVITILVLIYFFIRTFI